jgi:hypothetical protein
MCCPPQRESYHWLGARDGYRSQSGNHGEADEGEPSSHERFLLKAGIGSGHGASLPGCDGTVG